MIRLESCLSVPYHSAANDCLVILEILIVGSLKFSRNYFQDFVELVEVPAVAAFVVAVQVPYDDAL